MDGHSVCQDQWKLFSVDVELFHDYEPALDLFYNVRFVYVVKLNRDVVWSDRHHSTNGTIHQASVCVVCVCSGKQSNRCRQATGTRMLLQQSRSLKASSFHHKMEQRGVLENSNSLLSGLLFRDQRVCG